MKTLEHSENNSQKTLLGFWIYLMTDCVLFASFFATYFVLRNNTNGGEPGSELFSLPFIFIETLVLLTSSLTAGISVLALRHKKRSLAISMLIITIILGLTFLTLEIYEFYHLYHDGNSWTFSGFLSSYFSLVGLHGLHIFFGLLWATVLTVFILFKKVQKSELQRLTMWSMFWHFLDIVWIFIFTFVYLMGSR
jgi:cytochrome o ubiquinol oxidase subunit 3